MNISIDVEVRSGTQIELAAKEAIDLANRLGIIVRFTFNTVSCIAHPGGDPKVLVDNWRIAADRGGMYREASS
jgi:hypothetical protein